MVPVRSLDPLEPVVTAELMQNYLLESPVTAGAAVAIARGGDGNLNVFTLGTAGSVFVFSPDPGSDTGFSQTQIPGFTATQIAVDSTADGALIVFAPSGASVSFTQFDPVAAAWSTPQTWSQSLPSAIVQVKARRVGSDLFLTMFTSITGDGVTPPYNCTTVVWTGPGTTLDTAFDPVGLPVDSFSVEAVSGTPERNSVDFEFPPGFFTVLTPQIFTKMTNQYEAGPKTQDDANPNGFKHFTSWRPIAVTGYRPIGDFVRSGSDTSVPGDFIATLASVDDPLEPPLLYIPGDFRHVGAIWQIGLGQLSSMNIAAVEGVNKGYRPLSLRIFTDETAQDLADLLLVREDMLVNAFSFSEPQLRVAPHQEMINDFNLWMNMDNNEQVIGQAGPVAFDRVAADADSPKGPVHSGGISGNGFTAVAGWDGPFTGGFCLNATPQLVSHEWFRVAGPPQPNRQLAPVVRPAAGLVNSYSIADAENGTPPQVVAVVGGQLSYLNISQQAWQPLDPSGRTFLAVGAVANVAGLVEVFAIGSDRLLYHVEQNADGTFTQPVQIIAGHQFTFVTAARDGDGEAFGFAVTTNNHLFRLVKNEDLEWEKEEIEYENSNNLVEVRTFTTEITIRDQAGVVRPGASVQVWAEDVTPARINGQSYLLDPVLPVTAAASVSGTLTVVVETQGLATPILKWQATEFMPPDVAHMVEPNWRIQNQLKTVTAQDLSTNLGIDPSVATQIAPHIQNSMSLVPAKSGSRRGARAIASSAPFPNRIDASGLTHAWEVDFSTGSPVFRTLTAEEVRERRLAAASLPDLSLSDFFGDLGDLFNSIAEGISSVASLVVSKVKGFTDRVLAEFVVVLNNIKYKFNQLVEKIEQAFDLVMSLLAEIKVKFEQMVKWVGFLFAWDDILRTHDAIRGLLNEQLRFAVLATGAVNRRVKAGLTTLSDQLKTETDAFVTKVLGGTNTSLGGFEKQKVPADDQFQTNTGSNIVLTGFVDNAGKAPALASPLFLSPTGDDPITQLIAALESFGSSLNSNDPNGPLAKSIALFSQVGGSPDQAALLLLAAFVELGAALAELALNVAGAVVDALFAAVQSAIEKIQAILTEPIPIPFVTQLYETVIAPGRTLTLLDLIALIVAVPGTVFYKLLFKQAPFPDDPSIQAFGAAFTAEWIMAKTGLSGVHRSRSVADPPDPGPILRKVAAQLVGVHYAAAYACFAVLDAVMDFAAEASPPPMVHAALVLEWMIAIFGCPWLTDPTNVDGVSCTEDGTPFSNMVWATTAWLQPAVDTGYFVARKGLLRKGGATLPDTLALIADIALSWTFFGLVVAQHAKKCYPTATHAAQAYFSVVPGMTEFLRLDPVQKKTFGLSRLVQAFIDGVGYGSTAALQLLILAGITPLSAAAAD